MLFKYKTNNRTTGHRWALAKELCKENDIGKYAFSQRMINEWNRLPGECDRILYTYTYVYVYVYIYIQPS